jgi:CelD/BcsL family acetyltransferase involved in cellulose biosynthesis
VTVDLVVEISTPPAFPDPFLPEWKAFVADWPDATVAHDPTWLSVVEEEFSPGRSYRCIVRDHGSIAGIVGLMRPDKSTGFLAKRVLGMPHAFPVELSDVAIGPSHRTHHLLDSALEKIEETLPWDLLVFNRVRSRSCFVDSLDGISYRYALTDAGSCAYCDVRSPRLRDQVSKEQLKNVDRLRRRAEKEKGLVTVHTDTGPAVSSDAFDRFLSVEGAGWKGESGTGTALSVDLREQKFYRKVMARFGTDGRARIDFLLINGTVAAGQLAIRTGSTWFLLKIGYHPEYRSYGPGAILLKTFLEEMAADPEIHEVNLTVNPPWADRWHFQTEPVYKVLIYGRTWRGRALATGRIGKQLLKSIRARLPEWQATRVA